MKLIECPRDAMQGLSYFIPTDQKVRYLNQLLKVGFHTLDAGSFVSPKAIPQMKDTSDVFGKLKKEGTNTRLLAIVANMRGAEAAVAQPLLDDIGFPLSLSETFQQRNTNKSIGEALSMLDEMKELTLGAGKKIVVYLSMGFGNPYGDPYGPEIVSRFVDILKTMGLKTVSLADTVGMASPESVHDLFSQLRKNFPAVEVGVHLHATRDMAWDKIDAAYSAGCRRFDGALKGFGGCPMAEDELVGNVPTEVLIDYLNSKSDLPPLNNKALSEAMIVADGIFLSSDMTP